VEFAGNRIEGQIKNPLKIAGLVNAGSLKKTKKKKKKDTTGRRLGAYPFSEIWEGQRRKAEGEWTIID